MPDISMCQNSDCPSAEKCYRFMAVPNEYWQSLSDFRPNDGEIKCKYFMEIGGRRVRQIGLGDK